MEISGDNSAKKCKVENLSTSKENPAMGMRDKEDTTFRTCLSILQIMARPPSGRHAVRNMVIQIFVIGVLISSIIILLIHFTIPEADFLLVFIDKVSPVGVAITALLSIENLKRNRKHFEETVMLMRNDWNEQRTPEENEIKRKSFAKGKSMAWALIVSDLLGWLTLLSYGLATPLQDYFMPLNETRPKTLPFSFEYFDEQKYFFWLFCYTMLVSRTMNIIIVPLSVFHAITCTHICGMFHVVGIIQTYGVFAKSSILPATLVILIMGCTTFVELSYVDQINPKGIAIATTALFFYFFITYFGQNLIDSTSNVFWNAYNSRWYDYPVAAQKLLLIVMGKSYKYYSVNVVGFDEMSISTFGAVVRAAVSYCLAIRQIQ